MGTGNKNEPDDADYIIPRNHFYNDELLKLANLTPLMVDAGTKEPISLPQIGFKETDYVQAARTLRLSLLQDIDPTKDRVTPDVIMSSTALGGERFPSSSNQKVYFKLLANIEGPAPFNIVQPSIEDTLGVQRLQMLKKIPQPDSYDGPDVYVALFSAEVFNAILMIDFWNPVYSWRRGCLMKYVPREAKFDGKSYSLEAEFIEAVKKSPCAIHKIEGSPEHEFLQLISVDIKVHQKAMLDYIAAVEERIKNEPVKALTDYLTLAESRRRIYRPLPLDEFGPSMPFALALDPNRPLFKEMKSDGTIQDMPEQGVIFLKRWTASLAGSNPQILPQSDKSSVPVPVSIESLPPPATLNVACRGTTVGANFMASGRVSKVATCPFLSNRAANSEADPPVAPSLQLGSVPNWADDILPLISYPDWVSGDPESIGQHWIDSMQEYGNWRLDNYEDVKKRAVGIYQHLHSKTMPITRNPQNFWPDTAIEAFRQWANAGFPKDSSSPSSPQALIPKPVEPRDTFKVRKDIMSLSKHELAQYRAKLDDVLQVDSLGSLWQQLGVLRT